MEKTASKMQENASNYIVTGKPEEAKITTGILRHEHKESNSILIYSRDEIPFLINTALKRSLHLSLGSLSVIPNTNNRAPLEKETSEIWCKIFFKEHFDKLFYSPSPTEIGAKNNVKHFYLYCDNQWKPLLPQREQHAEIFTMFKVQLASEYFGSDNKFN